MDDVQKAKDLLLDDHNFSYPKALLVEKHLELIQFYRTENIWVALFRARHNRCDFYEVTYSTVDKTARIVSYNIMNTSIVHDE